jgi:outer membrane protein assembly factor BamB
MHPLSGWLALPVLVLAVSALPAEHWPQWRGPTGDSVSAAANVPLKWSSTENLRWKCPLPEYGVSTPAIWNDAVFLTAQQGEALQVLRIHAHTGQVQWTHTVGTGTAKRTGQRRKEQVFHRLHNLASPSPVTEGTHVVVHFGNGDLACYDFAGKQLWKRNLADDHGTYTIWWGHANSPVLWHDLVISVCMQDSAADLQKEPAPSYVVAHDVRTGTLKWKTLRMTPARSEDGDAYTTPIFRTVGDQTELIVMGGNVLDAYDPATGQRRWTHTTPTGSRTITGPTLAGERIFATVGKRGALFALQLGPTGPRQPSPVLWEFKQATPDTPCPVVTNGLLFSLSDDGIALCLDAATGEQKWRERLGGDGKASPLVANGRVYFLNTAGKCTVVAATGTFTKLAENTIADEMIASPAVAHGRLYLRGKQALYCIGTQE